ncbi:hypothetical protein SCYAM73S_04185 [Streptomyces cyaneofuscatus]
MSIGTGSRAAVYAGEPGAVGRSRAHLRTGGKDVLNRRTGLIWCPQTPDGLEGAGWLERCRAIALCMALRALGVSLASW